MNGAVPSSPGVSFVPMAVVARAIEGGNAPFAPVLLGGVPFEGGGGEPRVLAWLVRTANSAVSLNGWAQHHLICLPCSTVPRRLQVVVKGYAWRLPLPFAGRVSTLVSIPADRAGAVWLMPNEPTKTGRDKDGWRVAVATCDPWGALTARDDGYREGHPGSGHAVLSAWPPYGATVPHISGEALDGLSGWRQADHGEFSQGFAPYQFVEQRLRGDYTL